jgi:hypothetical protein
MAAGGSVAGNAARVELISLYRKTVGCRSGNMSVKSPGTSQHGLTARATCGGWPANAVRRRGRPAVRKASRGTGQQAHDRRAQEPKALCTDRGTPACFGMRVWWLRHRQMWHAGDVTRGRSRRVQIGLAYFDQQLLQKFKLKCPK